MHLSTTPLFLKVHDPLLWNLCSNDSSAYVPEDKAICQKCFVSRTAGHVPHVHFQYFLVCIFCTARATVQDVVGFGARGGMLLRIFDYFFFTCTDVYFLKKFVTGSRTFFRLILNALAFAGRLPSYPKHCTN